MIYLRASFVSTSTTHTETTLSSVEITRALRWVNAMMRIAQTQLLKPLGLSIVALAALAPVLACSDSGDKKTGTTTTGPTGTTTSGSGSTPSAPAQTSTATSEGGAPTSNTPPAQNPPTTWRAAVGVGGTIIQTFVSAA
jgi:hypothetical protein